MLTKVRQVTRQTGRVLLMMGGRDTPDRAYAVDEADPPPAVGRGMATPPATCARGWWCVAMLMKAVQGRRPGPPCFDWGLYCYFDLIAILNDLLRCIQF